MNSFNFKSAVCTSRSQSERLLALGLKRETADMCHTPFRSNFDGTLDYTEHCSLPLGKDIPAWSLHRLLSMLPDDAPNIYWILDGASISIEFEDENCKFFPHKGDIYEEVVSCIEWLIKEGYFNKEYLE